MRILTAPVSRDTIDAGIRAATYPGHSPARWALPLLDALDPGVDAWHLVELDEAALGALWLPAHAGEACHGDTRRLGEASDGSDVRTAHAWLTTHGEAYARANPSCWGRLSHAAASPQHPIVVSPVSVGDRVKPADAALVVVDGYHRALGYWMAGHRTCPAYLPVLRQS
ncbi:DUF6309 family protein [Luteitalea sp.]|uniref:DUF6309 family protein n=1 Tax=Luteitalea sp. TaxID=2004800 RepID=UPI0025BA8F45|nr:DUF6309 family protein [Luteitalea sp.]